MLQTQFVDNYFLVIIIQIFYPIFPKFEIHLFKGGMSNMIGLPSDRALVEDDECLRFILCFKCLMQKIGLSFSQ